MTSICSYIFTAFYNWLRDNEINPRLLVDVTHPGIQVPKHLAVSGMVLISIDHRYVEDFEVWPNKISFTTRFQGQKEYVIIPYSAMLELLCTEINFSIPISMWLTSIDTACHTLDDGSFVDDAPKEKDDPCENKVYFCIVDEDDEADSSSSKDKSKLSDAGSHSKKNPPKFTCVE